MSRRRRRQSSSSSSSESDSDESWSCSGESESEEELCDYEKRRLDNIRRNQQMMRSLGKSHFNLQLLQGSVDPWVSYTDVHVIRNNMIAS